MNELVLRQSDGLIRGLFSKLSQYINSFSANHGQEIDMLRFSDFLRVKGYEDQFMATANILDSYCDFFDSQKLPENYRVYSYQRIFSSSGKEKEDFLLLSFLLDNEAKKALLKVSETGRLPRWSTQYNPNTKKGTRLEFRCLPDDVSYEDEIRRIGHTLESAYVQLK